MGAQLRVVRRRIRSVNSTKKITRAMELIASSRIVKAQQRVEASRPYAIQLTKAMEDVARQTGSLSHPLLEERDRPARAGVLIVTSDRGLAGSYNANVLKIAEEAVGRIRGRGLEPVLYVVGKKGLGYFRFRAVPVRRSWLGFSEVPTYAKAEEIGQALILDFLLPQYLVTKVYAALLESAASENAARRRAMKAATDNAEELIKILTRQANRARQDEITTEISEIVGGAEALAGASKE